MTLDYQNQSKDSWTTEKINDRMRAFGTHPIGHIGADDLSLDRFFDVPFFNVRSQNRNPHGTYPFPGVWRNVGQLKASEEVHGLLDFPIPSRLTLFSRSLNFEAILKNREKIQEEFANNKIPLSENFAVFPPTPTLLWKKILLFQFLGLRKKPVYVIEDKQNGNRYKIYKKEDSYEIFGPPSVPWSQRYWRNKLKEGNSNYLSYGESDIRLIPDWERVHNRVLNDPDLELENRNSELIRKWSWLVLPVRWGYPLVESPTDIVPLKRTDLGNASPLGPAYNSGWNRVGAGPEYQVYRPNIFPEGKIFDPLSGIGNSYGILNLLAGVPGYNTILGKKSIIFCIREQHVAVKKRRLF
jgi:hypothetical protein